MANPDDIGERHWRRITATVRPLKQRTPVVRAKTAKPVEPDFATALANQPAKSKPKGRVPAPLSAPVKTPPPPRMAMGAEPLDGSWERQLRGGRASPDMVIDLHGHSLASAHVHLSRALDRATAHGARILLVVAGKVRGPDEAPRGAIRREIETWLAHSSHARRILAVRGAHPRHGGAGALYIILKKPG